MDWLQFTAAIVGYLAWPTVIIVLFIILRKHMGALADRMLEFNFGGAKILFDKALEKGAEIIEQAPFPQLPKLVLGILPFVVGRYAGVDRNPCGHETFLLHPFRVSIIQHAIPRG